jgi:hypothetical protein
MPEGTKGTQGEPGEMLAGLASLALENEGDYLWIGFSINRSLLRSLTGRRGIQFEISNFEI